jgi:hypothetical protein
VKKLTDIQKSRIEELAEKSVKGTQLPPDELAELRKYFDIDEDGYDEAHKKGRASVLKDAEINNHLRCF